MVGVGLVSLTAGMKFTEYLMPPASITLVSSPNDSTRPATNVRTCPTPPHEASSSTATATAAARRTRARHPSRQNTIRSPTHMRLGGSGHHDAEPYLVR